MKNKHVNSVDYDDYNFEKIVEENAGIITSIIKNMELECGHFKLSWEDLYQEGLIALHNAYKNYNPKQNVKFSTYAYMIINRSLHRYYYQQITHYQNESYSLDNVELYDHNKLIGDNLVGDHGLRYELEDKKTMADKFFTILSLEDQHIVALRINNNSYKEIAEKLNITVKRVDNRLLRIKDRFTKNNMTYNYGI